MKKLIIFLSLISTLAYGQRSSIDSQFIPGVNLLENPGAEFGTARWVETGSATFTKTTTAANVGYGAAAFSWDAGAAAQKIASNPVSPPEILRGRQCHAEFAWKGGDANITAQVVNGSAEVLTSQVLEAVTTYKTMPHMVFPCPDPSDTVAIEFVAGADAAVIYLDQVFVGISSSQTGPHIGPWTEYTPTFSNFTAGNATYKFEYQRNGASINIRSYIKYASGNPFTSTFSFSIPSGLNMDIDADEKSSINYVGRGSAYDSSPGTIYQAAPVIASTSTTTSFAVRMDNETTQGSVLNASAPFAFASGDVIYLYIDNLPIAEWANSGTVNLTNDSVAYANARFSVEGLDSAKVVPSSTVTTINTWSAANFNKAGGSWDGTDYTIPADGEYQVRALIRWASANIALTSQIMLYKNTSTQIAIHQEDFSDDSNNPSQLISYIGQFSKGDTIRVVVNQDSGGSISVRADDSLTQFSVVRLSEYSAGSTSGQPFASATTGGLVPSYATGSKAVDGSFGGGTIYYTRIGNLVTLTGTILSHPNDVAATTSVGFLPEHFRPTAGDAYNSFAYDTTAGYNIYVTTTGTVNVYYQNETAGVNKTSTAISPTISYVVQ